MYPQAWFAFGSLLLKTSDRIRHGGAGGHCSQALAGVQSLLGSLEQVMQRWNGLVDAWLGWEGGCAHAYMDGCVPWVNGSVGGRLHGWMDAWVDGCMHARMHGWMDAWLDG